MYHGQKTVIGRYLLSGKGGTNVGKYLCSIDAQKASEIDNELNADLFYRKHNKLTKAHSARLKKIRKRIQKAIAKNRFPAKLTRFGNAVEEFSLPDINSFFCINKGFEVLTQDGYFATLFDPENLVISSYIEGDVERITCKDIKSFNAEIAWHRACE